MIHRLYTTMQVWRLQHNYWRVYLSSWPYWNGLQCDKYVILLVCFCCAWSNKMIIFIDCVFIIFVYSHLCLCVCLCLYSQVCACVAITYFTLFTDCLPQCKFGDCNTTIGKCICPPGHSGADCSVISEFPMIICPHSPTFNHRQVFTHMCVYLQ